MDQDNSQAGATRILLQGTWENGIAKSTFIPSYTME